MINQIDFNPALNMSNNGIASFLFLLMASRRGNSAMFADNFSDNAGYAFARQIKSVDKKHQLPEAVKSTFEFIV